MSKINFLPPWVETNEQPAFYDLESGTCLQQTARMYNKVNELVRTVNNQNDIIDNQNDIIADYIEQFNILHDYVYDYFDNLDVQDEVNHKLDEMAGDGTLAELMSPAYDEFNKNSALLGKFYQKLNKRATFIVNCQGDSLTYGQDTVSGDIRPASSDPVDNGAVHTQTRASVTYPEELQADFDAVIGSGIATVNNLGFSGDSAKLSFERWTINRHADLALIMLGTNDSRNSSSWLPAEYRNNISEYLEYMSKIIEQYLSWDTAVILIAPPSTRDNSADNKNGTNTTHIYADVLKNFARKYNCPIVDSGAVITNNFNSDFYSDNVHFNGTGYKAIADKLFAIFCGTGILNGNFNISSKKTVDSSDNRPVTFSTNGIALSNVSPANTMLGNNKLITVRANGVACYGFNIKYDNALIIPIGTHNNDITITADFGSTQPLSTYKKSNNGVNYQTQISGYALSIAATPNSLRYLIPRAIIKNEYLLLNSKGYHTIQLTHNSNTSDFYFNGFLIMPINEISRYLSEININMYGETVSDNEYNIPLNLINLIRTSNMMNERNNNTPSITPLTDLTILSKGGVECYKLQLMLNNADLPLDNTAITAINTGLAHTIKYIDEDFADGTGYKTTVASVAVDANNLVITFDSYNSSNNTSITIR